MPPEQGALNRARPLYFELRTQKRDPFATLRSQISILLFCGLSSVVHNLAGLAEARCLTMLVRAGVVFDVQYGA